MKNARCAAAAGHKTTQRRRRPPVRRRTALVSQRAESTATQWGAETTFKDTGMRSKKRLLKNSQKRLSIGNSCAFCYELVSLDA